MFSCKWSAGPIAV